MESGLKSEILYIKNGSLWVYINDIILGKTQKDFDGTWII